MMKLNRRTVLRGALGGVSAAVALPLLECMLDENGEALADGNALPRRFITWSFGNGVILNQFVPQQTGSGFTLSPELAPLAGVSNYLTVLTGFDNRTAYNVTHHEGMGIFSGYDIRDVFQGPGFFSNYGGPTIDQVIANLPSVGGETTIRSIQMAVSKRVSSVDFGTTTHNLSHRGYLQPLPPERNPVTVFAQLFGGFSGVDDPHKPLRLSVLDIVRDKIGQLRKRVGASDDARLVAHLDGISELENKVSALPPICTAPDPLDAGQPRNTNTDVGGRELIADVNEVMSDLLVHAFRCDITRVGSMLFSEAAAETVFGDLLHNDVFHELTHLQNEQQTRVHDGVVYQMEQLAYLCNKLKDEPDPSANGQNLLDSTAIFCSSDSAEGYTHSVSNQPMIIVGGAGGKLVTPGIHYASPNGENPSDALLALLQCYDESATSVGEGETGSTNVFDIIKASSA